MNTIEILKRQHGGSGREEWQSIEGVVASDPDIMDGLPIFKGTRIPVYIILDYLAEGYDTSDIIKDYPGLDEKKIRVALKFAEMLASLHSNS